MPTFNGPVGDWTVPSDSLDTVKPITLYQPQSERDALAERILIAMCTGGGFALDAAGWAATVEQAYRAADALIAHRTRPDPQPTTE